MALRTQEYIGLCRVCDNGPNCTFRKDVNRPAYYCEEFFIETFRSVRYLIPETPREESEPVENSDESNAIGLCRTCGNRDSCTFQKPEGGIWHCEEYA